MHSGFVAFVTKNLTAKMEALGVTFASEGCILLVRVSVQHQNKKCGFVALATKTHRCLAFNYLLLTSHCIVFLFVFYFYCLLLIVFLPCSLQVSEILTMYYNNCAVEYRFLANAFLFLVLSYLGLRNFVELKRYMYY